MEEFVRALFGGRARKTEEPRQKHQVLSPRQILVDRGELTGQADPPANLMSFSDDIVAEHGSVASIGTEQGGKQSHNRRLARTVGAEETVDTAPTNAKVNTSQRLRPAERFDDTRRLDGERIGFPHDVRYPALATKMPIASTRPKQHIS